MDLQKRHGEPMSNDKKEPELIFAVEHCGVLLCPLTMIIVVVPMIIAMKEEETAHSIVLVSSIEIIVVEVTMMIVVGVEVQIVTMIDEAGMHAGMEGRDLTTIGDRIAIITIDDGK